MCRVTLYRFATMRYDSYQKAEQINRMVDIGSILTQANSCVKHSKAETQQQHKSKEVYFEITFSYLPSWLQVWLIGGRKSSLVTSCSETSKSSLRVALTQPVKSNKEELAMVIIKFFYWNGTRNSWTFASHEQFFGLFSVHAMFLCKIWNTQKTMTDSVQIWFLFPVPHSFILFSWEISATHVFAWDTNDSWSFNNRSCWIVLETYK